MKILLLILIYFYVTLPLESRLIPKYTERTTEAKSVDLSSSRVTRSVYEDETGRSKEYDVSSEYTTGEKKRSVFTGMPTGRYTLKTTRVIRESNESPSETPNNTTPNPDQQTPLKGTLIKKPIPKFNEMDYDDDFQTKIIRSQSKLADSGEHEDEDFNVDDYDFDVNHDEFSGRGKPLEPRVKDKRILEQNVDPETETSPTISVAAASSVVKNQNKVVAVKALSKRNGVKVRTSKRATNDDNVKKHLKKASEKGKDDYYDDESSTSTARSEAETKAFELDEVNEDREDSKEFKHRATRSSLHSATLKQGWKEEKASIVKRLMSATSNGNESPFISEPLVFTWF